MTNEELSHYRATLTDLTGAVSRLCDVEEALAKAASEDDTAQLDHLVRSSEADVLTFRGLDRKRFAEEKAMGLAGVPFGEILNHLTGDERAFLEPSASALQSQLQRFREAQETADRIMRVRRFDIKLKISDAPLESTHETRA